MIIFEMKFKNFLSFRDFHMDMSIPRVSKFSPIKQEHSDFPNLKYKKIAILLGANASGKTLLGKSICLIQNFLGGKEIQNLSFLNLKDNLDRNQDEKSQIEVVFAVGRNLVKMEVEICSEGICREKWIYTPLKNAYYNTLLKDLDKTDNVLEKEHTERKEFSSYFLNSEEHEEFKNLITPFIGYVYSFSGEMTSSVIDLEKVDVRILEKILLSFDNSIRSVKDSEEVDGNKILTFMNGHKEIILKNGNLTEERKSILSTGTKESIFLSYLLYTMMSKGYNTHYIDEKMSHSHSEIEQQIIQIMISMIEKKDGQVFITSHNSDLLRMKLPNYNFMLFRKNLDGTIGTLVQPEKVVKHNDRTLKKIIENDIFSTAPQLDDLIELHDMILSDENE